jgi:transcriptional regulator with XRE-family HTH domain
MSFREVLASELACRRARNRRYSLRAFARDLSIDHATLSQLMRGVRRITPRVIAMLAPQLRLTVSDITRHSADAVDAALLEAIAKPDFQTSSRWIAIRLGISVDEINIALQRLLYTRRVSMTKESEWAIV